MNTSFPTNVEQIGVYKDILSDEFVKETVARKEYILDNNQNSHASCSNVKQNCSQITEELNGVKGALREGIGNYERLTESSLRYADDFIELSKKLRAVSNNIMKQSQLIRENSQRL